MEKVLTDVVNAGIALFRAGEEALKSSVVDFEKKFNEIKQKGELDQSEQAVQVRDLLNKTIKDTKDVLDNANSSYKDIITKAQTNFEGISAQLDQALPEQVKSQAKAALDELKALIEKYRPQSGATK
jgi:actin-like ATPase involved in cell morphogenesis